MYVYFAGALEIFVACAREVLKRNEHIQRHRRLVKLLNVVWLPDLIYSPFQIAEMLQEASRESSNIVWYLIDRAADNFVKAHGRKPGSQEDNSDYSSDVPLLKEVRKSI